MQSASPLGPGRALTLPCGRDNAGHVTYISLGPLSRAHAGKFLSQAEPEMAPEDREKLVAMFGGWVSDLSAAAATMRTMGTPADAII